MLIIETPTTKSHLKYKYILREGIRKGEKIDACSLFSALAIQTWERFHFAYERKGFKIYETTITQNLLYQIEKARSFLDKKIILREAVDEEANGNDIEFVITDGIRSFTMPMQAKRVYKDLNYSTISHKGQIDSLINYAKKIKGIPMYLLYNYNKDFTYNVNLCSIESDQRQYGCSLIDAIHIREKFTTKAVNSNRKWSIPKFKDLVPYPSIPWIVIPCCLTDKFGSLEEVFDVLKIDSDYRKELNYVDFKSHEDIMNDNAWKELKIFQNKKGSLPKDDENEEPKNKPYNPGFQIIINFD